MIKMMNYRIYPTKDQVAELNQWLGSARFVWNHFLEKTKEKYEQEKKFLFYYDMATQLPSMKDDPQYSFLKNVPSQSLQHKCKDLETAIKRCYKDKFGFPHFKSRKTDFSGISIPQSWKIEDSKLSLPKLKSKIKIKLHRPLEGKSKTLTLKKTKTNKWFITICCHAEDVEPIAVINSTVGLDLGLKEFLVSSDGEVIKNPKHLRNKLHKVKRAQKALSRKKKGSKNREKSRLKLAVIHEKVANERKDFLNKTASSITKEYDLISIEDLAVKNMVKNHKLAFSIQDVSWSMFRSILEWHCKKRGKHLSVIDRFYPSSKTCSTCGHKKKILELSERIFSCDSCGMELDRDLNAAININRVGTTQIHAYGVQNP